MEYLDIQIRSRSCFSRTMPLRPPLQSFGLTQRILGHGVQITADDCLSGRSSPQRVFPYFAFHGLGDYYRVPVSGSQSGMSLLGFRVPRTRPREPCIRLCAFIGNMFYQQRFGLFNIYSVFTYSIMHGPSKYRPQSLIVRKSQPVKSRLLHLRYTTTDTSTFIAIKLVIMSSIRTIAGKHSSNSHKKKKILIQASSPRAPML